VTAYVFGAGASYHAGYPLACDLGDSLIAWLKRNPSPVNDLYGANLRELDKIYGGLNAFEQVLTELEDCPSGSRAAAIPDIDRRYMIRNLNLMIPEFFRALRERPAPLYEELAHRYIQQDDEVITFNYDVACERELRLAGAWEINDGYGFSLGIPSIRRSPSRVLKLHGSANWLEVPFRGQTGFSQSPPNALGDRPVILPGEFDFFGYPGCRDPLGPVGNRAGAVPAIVMPTSKKRFFSATSSGRELEMFWTSLWESAELALRSAEHIVIIGYGMSAVDERARALLLCSPNRSARVEIFCGGSTDRIAREFLANGFQHVSGVSGQRFEDFLARRAATAT